MNTNQKWIIGIALAGLLALGSTVVYAAAPTQDTPATPAAVDEAETATLEWAPGDRIQFFAAKPLAMHDDLLANSLGITTDELADARQQAYTAALADAVEQGVITQDQADRFQDEEGMGLFLLKDSYDRADADAFLAEALGITAEELQSARDNAITKGVEAGLLTEEEGKALQVRKLVADAMSEARTEAIGQAVEQGLLTQEEADEMLAHPVVAGLELGGRMGMHGHFMGGGLVERGMRFFGFGPGMGDDFGGKGMRDGMMGRGWTDESDD